VVIEFGMVNFFGKNIEERAMAMISLAHPDFRDILFNNAMDSGCQSHRQRGGERVKDLQAGERRYLIVV
jgi:acyl-CoA hydrolase